MKTKDFGLSSKLSLIVSSSDGYEDCWDPFFTLLKIYFPGVENLEILLSTQTKEYRFQGLNIKVVKNGTDAAWSKRLRQTLELATHNIILFVDEDAFLRSEVNIILLNQLVDLMAENKEIGHIRIAKGNWDVSESKYELLQELKPGARQRFMMVIGLWKKEVLLRHLVDHESTWTVEKWATVRSNILKDGFYCLRRAVIEKEGSPFNSADNGGIYKGKWIREYVVPLFKKNGIRLDYSKRGFFSQKTRLLTRFSIRLEPIKHPVLTVRSLLSILELRLSKN